MFTIVQFSPTGNTAYLAHQLSKQLDGCRVYALEHTSPFDIAGSEHLVIFFAVHAFNAPKTVKRFVKALPPNKYKSISLIGVGCNDIWINTAATQELRKILSDKSYPIIVDEIIAMPLTLVMNFPESLIKDQIEKANRLIPKLANNIREGIASVKVVPFKARLIHFAGKIEPFAARFFGLELHANQSCNQCGLCIRECPEKNIKENKDGKIHFGFKCMMCMRCIYHCPQKAISPRISKFIPIKNGYTIAPYISSALQTAPTNNQEGFYEE